MTEPVESAELLGAAKALSRLYDREEETRLLLKELTERERFIKSLVDAAPSVVCLYDLRAQRTLYMSANRNASLDYALEEFRLHGQDALVRLVDGEDLPQVLDGLARLPTVKDGQVLEVECRIQNSSQDWRWINLRIVIFLRDAEGQPAQILATSQDITERKQNEQARIDGEAELLRIEQRWTAELERKVSNAPWN